MSAAQDDKPSLASELQQLTLAYYHCTFFFPLIPNLGKALPPEPDAVPEHLYSDANATDAEREAYHFFTPILRNVLFNQADNHTQTLSPLQEWRLSDTQDWTLTLTALPPNPEKPDAYVVPDKTVDVVSVRLYRYFNGLQLLAVTVKPAAGQSLILEDWLHFTRLARQLYPTFAEQIQESKVAPLTLRCPQATIEDTFSDGALKIPPNDALGLYFSPIIKYFIKQFFHETAGMASWLEQQIALYDDRMFISVAYGLPEDAIKTPDAATTPDADVDAAVKRKRERLEQIKALVAYTDRGVDAWIDGIDGYHYPYDPQYIAQDLADKKLTLWEQAGSTYFYTDAVNAYLGIANAQNPGDFFITKIAEKDILSKYNRMLIQALFYQASLRHYDQQITVSTKTLLSSEQQENSAIEAQYSELIQFTNQYWFADLTQQMQGKAIGRLQQNGLGLSAQYARILDEVSRTSDYLTAQKDQTLAEASLNSARASEKLTKYGAWFAVIAIVLALLAMLPDWMELLKIA